LFEKVRLWERSIDSDLLTLTNMATTFGDRTDSLGYESQEIRTPLLSQKVELISELAQAMANQFNNIMMAVTSYAELELKKAGRKDRHGLEQVLNHATRATSLIQKLLEFSRKHTPSPQALEVDAIVSDLSVLLNELVGGQAELTLKLDSGASRIRADRIDLEQTLFTLAVIARNAMGNRGNLTISTSTADVDDQFIGSDNAAPGRFVILAVASECQADSSPSASVDQSQSVNLYLTAVRGLLRDCRGLVRFSSEAGARRCFSLYFPVSSKDAEIDNGRTLPRNPAVARTILVVEDDDAVRIPAAEFLMMEGFKVLQARTGSEAMGLVQQSRSTLDILITDIYMPRMSGHQVAAKLLEQHPDLKVLYISGDPERAAAPAVHVAPSTVLRKPFPLSTLRDKIHDLLGE
jgi:two-component system, cell cycle sensor histidine kinase and response regulator CckA